MKKKVFLVVWLLILITAVCWNGFVKPDSRIPFVPIVDISIDGRDLPPIRSSGDVVDNKQITAELKEIFGKYVPVKLADRSYQSMSHCDMEEMVQWMDYFYWSTPRLKYRSEFYDCDNFARMLVAMIDLAAVPQEDTLTKDIFQGQVTVFRIYTRNVKSWGGVSGTGGGHALCIFRSDQGWYVYEPQSGMIDDLKDYPNLRYIWEVNGD